MQGPGFSITLAALVITGAGAEWVRRPLYAEVSPDERNQVTE